MIELGRHIEALLLDNDCVIVPDFGGFVAHHVCARYDEEDRSWLPPMRTLGFNPQLRINDSLLAQSYVSIYDISYPEALRRIEDEVEELKRQLSNKGHYSLDNIGTLSINDESNYDFEPCEGGILTPDVYGLGCCEFFTLKDTRNAKPTTPDYLSVASEKSTKEPKETLEEKEEKPTDLLEFTDEGEPSDIRTIHIRMSWVRNTIAAAAAIIAFFVMATPIANSDLRTRTMSHLQNNLLYKLIPQDTNMAPASPVVDTIPTQVASAQRTTAADTLATAKTPSAATTSTSFCIVFASHVKMSNAEEYVEELKKRGYDDAAVYVHNKVVRVVYGSYDTENEAYRQLKKLNSKEEFSQAWVYKKKSEA